MHQALRSRLEAVQKLRLPTTVKGCRSFAGMVNLLNIFFPELQNLLKSIYVLTRKSRQFIWGEEQQIVFEEIKYRSVKLLVLYLPDNKGRFHLYSETSKFALYQIQNEKPKLIPHASKRLPKAVRSYSITGLEMCGLSINIASFCIYQKE